MNHAAERELRKLSLIPCYEAPTLRPPPPPSPCPERVLLKVCLNVTRVFAKRLLKKAEMNRYNKTEGTILANAELNVVDSYARVNDSNFFPRGRSFFTWTTCRSIKLIMMGLFNKRREEKEGKSPRNLVPLAARYFCARCTPFIRRASRARDISVRLTTLWEGIARKSRISSRVDLTHSYVYIEARISSNDNALKNFDIKDHSDHRRFFIDSEIGSSRRRGRKNFLLERKIFL